MTREQFMRLENAITAGVINPDDFYSLRITRSSVSAQGEHDADKQARYAALFPCVSIETCAAAIYTYMTNPAQAGFRVILTADAAEVGGNNE